MIKRKRLRSKKTNSSNLTLLITLLVLVAITLVGKSISQKQSSQNKNVLGALLSKGGDSDDDSSGSSGSGSSGSDSSESRSNDSGSGSSGGSGSTGSGTSGGTASTPIPTKVNNEDEGEQEIRTEQETKKDGQLTEIRLSETERIRTRTKDGRTRMDITAGGIKTRFEVRDGRVVIKAEREDGTEVELENEAIFKIEERLATNQIKIATDSANRIVIQRGNTGAVSQFPISIDLATNTLTVTTPSGVKKMITLPDQVIQNLLATNVVSRLGGSMVVNAVRTGEVSTLSQVVTLGEKNGVPVYEINGLSDQKLLGFIAVSIPKIVEVSAETGEVLSTQTSIINRAIDLVSF